MNSPLQTWLIGTQHGVETHYLSSYLRECDGDRAYQSYATTLHRLRKLLGEEDLIQVKDRKVSLDPYRCWVDVWAFEHLLEQAAIAKKEGEVQKSLNLCDQALQSYRGPFLSHNEYAHWATRLRERRRKHYMAHVGQLCQAWTCDGKVEEARSLFHQALEQEPGIEFL